MGTIVVGYIDTPQGHTALEVAISEAKLRNMKVALIHSMLGGGKEPAEEYVAASEAVQEAHNRLEAEGVEHCTHEFVRGKTPAEDVIAAVNDHNASLIVIGVRQRSTTGKVLLGSNALEILHDSRVPVLCVKPR